LAILGVGFFKVLRKNSPMRLSHLRVLLCYLLLIPTVGNAQLYHPATWHAADTGRDTGVLWLRTIHLTSTSDFAYGHRDRGRGWQSFFIPRDHQHLNWLESDGDTLLRRAVVAGEELFLQLRLQGQVSLYSTLALPWYRRYFWRDAAGRWYPLNGEQLWIVVDQLLPPDCAESKRVKRGKPPWRESQLVRLTKTINQCLNSAVYKPNLSWQSPGAEVGLSVGSAFDKRSTASYLFTVFPLDPDPRFGLSYQRQLLRHRPAWRVQVQARLWSYRLRAMAAPTLVNGSGSSAFSFWEAIDLDQLYLSGGPRWQPLGRQRFSPILGAGAVWVLPLKFERRLEKFDTGSATPGLPDEQVLRGGVWSTLGWYGEVGLRYSFSKLWKINLLLRSEQIVQGWEGWDRFDPLFLATSNFSFADRLFPQQNSMWQVTLWRRL
jgi:hypothetical protein